MTGARLVEVGDDIASLASMVEIGRSKGVPVIADACSQIYPLDYFTANARSADLVTFGAKYMGAPHSTGFVCGKRELIETVAASPSSHTIMTAATPSAGQ